MPYIPWNDYDICRHWMLKGCLAGKNCKLQHPPNWREVWNEYIERQKADEQMGIPPPRKPSQNKARVRDLATEINEADGQKPSSARRPAPLHAQAQAHPSLPKPPPPPPATSMLPLSSHARQQSKKVPKFMESGLTDFSRTDVLPALEINRYDVGPESRPPPSLGYNDSEPITTRFGELQFNLTSWGSIGAHSPTPAKFLHQTQTMGAIKRTSNGEAKASGPHPSIIRVSAPYSSQAAIEKKLQPPVNAEIPDVQERSLVEAREDSCRLQGCIWLDNVRRALDLPIRTYTTACTYYHKFRLAHPGVFQGLEPGINLSWADACAASLLTSCKVEDTLKKSRDILAAAYNLKSSAQDHLGSDDAIFEGPSKIVIGAERLVLEAGGFDFRSRHPHALLVKIAKSIPEGNDEGRKMQVAKLAYSVLTDLHRTFAPLKQTSATLALASLELAAHLDAIASPDSSSTVRDAMQSYDIKAWSTTREEIMETLLDALDLYTHHTSSTVLGPLYSLDDFLRIRLTMNKECAESSLPRHTAAPGSPGDLQTAVSTLRVANGHPTPVSPQEGGAQAQQAPQNGPSDRTRMDEYTQRFMLNPQRAANEKAEVQKFFVEEWEEYEEEIEVPITQGQARTERDGKHRHRDRTDVRDRLADRPRDSNRIDPPADGQRSRTERDQERDRERQRLRDRERDVERERARLRDRERERDRRPPEDHRERRFDERRDRRYDDDRRRRDDRR